MTTAQQNKEPATQQTASGFPELSNIKTNLVFNDREIELLRRLANTVAAIAARPEMGEKAKLWTAHNDLMTDTPTVFVDPENGWNEIISTSHLLCTDPLARVWEMSLRKQIFWADQAKDDKVIEATFEVPYSYTDTGWGLDPLRIGGENNGSYIVKPVIEDYEDDFERVHYPQYIIDKEQSDRVLALANDVFDGILSVTQKGIWWWSLGMTKDYIALRGFENFLMDMIIAPDWVHKMMNMLCEGKLTMLDQLEADGLLPDNTGATYVGSGGFGYTTQLPGPDFNPKKVRTMDMWGFSESQETVSCSSEMYAEFIYPYEKRLLERFGLNCYGCCEGYDNRWHIIKQLPRLRRISVSPWADWNTIKQNLSKEYIASLKLSPTPLSTAIMEEDTVRADAKKAVQLSKDCVAEYIMKDNHTLGDNPNNIIRWVQIMREEIDKS
ncbi:MAG: hypothetical protein FWG21_05115 [Oscillospiraceae bacterium]|nr:hypothetical protein [Oscillospiraceae bacterium]